MTGEGQLGCGGEDAGMCRISARLRQVDEYRFAVTQFAGDSLSICGVDGACVDDAQWIAELPVRIGENAEHCHIDGHVPDATTCRTQPGSGGAALVAAHGVEHCDTGI